VPPSDLPPGTVPPPPPPSPSRSLARLVGPACALVAAGAVGNVIFAWVSAGGLPAGTTALLRHPALYAGAVLALVPWLTHTARLLVWAAFLGRPLPPRRAFACVLANEAGSAVTPTAAGGGYAKVALLIQFGFPAGTAMSLMILGSLEDYAFFALAVPVALLFSGAWPAEAVAAAIGGVQQRFGGVALTALAVGAAACVAFVALRRHPRLRTFGRDFAAAFHLILRRGKTRFALTLALTAVHWLARFSVAGLVLVACDAPVDPVRIFLLQGVVFLLGTIAPTPGGMVGVEAAFYLTYRALVPGDILPLAVAAWRLLTFYSPLALGAVLFVLLRVGWSPLPAGARTPQPA
jgi:uncharacterized membrane protein YbhN (UPF0104 family)